MTRRRKTGRPVEEYGRDRATAHEPRLTHVGFLISLTAIALGFVAEIAIAYMIFPKLPARIPSYWVGNLVSGETVPSWVVWLVFPVSQLILLGVALLSPKDTNGKTVMTTGKACTVSILAAIFAMLEASAFNLPHL